MRRPRVTGVRIRGNTIRERVDGHPVFDFIKVTPYVPMVAHYKKREPVVLIDRKLHDPGHRRCASVHEATERYLRYQRGTPKTTAHQQSERVEHHFARREGINWNKYGHEVERVFRKNRRRGSRRRR